MNNRRQAAADDFQTLGERLQPEPARSYAHRLMVFGPCCWSENGRYCKVSAQESFCFSTLPHHPAGRQQTCRTRLSVDKSIEATTPHGPATWLASCVLGVARRFECSEVARTAYGACGSDRRSVGAWTERAPNLRCREGVLALTFVVTCQMCSPMSLPCDPSNKSVGA